MKQIYFLLCILVLLTSCHTNSERDYIRRGNRYYRQAQNDTTSLDNAVTEYQKALSVDSTCARAHYNKGDALILQGKDSVALEEFKLAKQNEQNPLRISHICHNMGVLLQGDKQFAQAIECYKEALRNNPSDDESRYNLALCQYQLKNDENNQDGNGQDNQQNQDDQNQDQNDNKNKQQDQNGNQNKDEQQQSNKGDKSDEQKQNEDAQQDQQKQKPNEISKDAAEQMLNAAMQNERRTQERINKYNQSLEDRKSNSQNRRIIKNW